MDEHGLDQLPIENQPDPKAVQFLEEQIYNFNVAATGITDGDLLSVFLRNDQSEIMAGIFGWTWGGTCEIRYLWVHTDWRGKGIGRGLLVRAEHEAIRRGCKQIVLDTHSFQAPGFYLKLGYQVIGLHSDYPQGHQMYYLRKVLGER
jgi:ribosomal protein S18 acetylase RimI-like enzyme